MKIVHIIGGGDVGGAKTHVLSLVSKLSENNEVVLVSLREGEFSDDARKLGINTVVIKNKNPLKDFSDLKKLINGGGFEIVHCHGSKANVMVSAIRAFIKAPVITTVHSDYRLDYLGSILKRLTFGVLNTVALRFLDGYIGVTNAFSDLLIGRGFDPYKLFTLNNGIEFTPLAPSEDRESYLKKLGIDDENAILCGIAARFHPVKDIPTALRALSKIKEVCPHLYLVLGGDGEEAENLKAFAKELGIENRVVFAGWIDDMDSFLNAVDISVISSVSEGFPYSILESIRARCTMVSTKVGAMPEIIDDGENGILFDVGDSESLAEHIKYLYDNRSVAYDMAEKLLKKAREKYSFEAMISTQLSIYDRVLKRRNEKKASRVLLCGSYGRGNAGDDAILKAVIDEIYDANEAAEICVMSKNPKQTRLAYRVRSIYTFNVFKILCEMRKSALYINGGGSLIQDSTSSRSLYFYLFTLWAAELCGCKVMMYGCGIGPVRKRGNRRLASKVINKSVDCITLRDPDSFEELQKMNVKRPTMFLAADPTLRISPISENEISKIFEEEGLSLSESYLCLAMRNWKGIDEKIPHIVSAAKYASEKYGLSVALIPMERSRDLPLAERIKEEIGDSATVIRGKHDVHTVIGILSKMRVIMAMRLHALVFGAGQGVATIGIAYDDKVSGFMNYIGREMCVLYNACNADILKSFIDTTMSDSEYRSNMENACRMMRENEKENTRRLREIFGKEVEGE